jgi:Amt family ammonium transporter
VIWLVIVGLIAAAIATGALFVIARPIMDGRMLWPALGAAAAGALLTIGLGSLFGIASLGYLIGVSAFAVPILVLLEAAAIGSGADRTGRWILLLAWGVVVFPLAALVPLWLTAACAGTDCELEDFGGALPLLVSSSAFVLLAWLPAGVVERASADPHSNRRAMAALLVLWFAVVLWLVQLEGAIDEFVPRILLAGLVGPVAGGLGWLIADRARGVSRPIPRSLVLGIIAGLAAVLPGAVTVTFPWTIAVGWLAGALGSLAYSARGSASAGIATRWGFVILVAVAVGFVAPAIAGDTVGILFSAHLDVLSTPVTSLLGVTLLSVLVSAPAWVLLRRTASREPVPAAISSDAAAAGASRGEP